MSLSSFNFVIQNLSHHKDQEIVTFLHGLGIDESNSDFLLIKNQIQIIDIDFKKTITKENLYDVIINLDIDNMKEQIRFNENNKWEQDDETNFDLINDLIEEKNFFNILDKIIKYMKYNNISSINENELKELFNIQSQDVIYVLHFSPLFNSNSSDYFLKNSSNADFILSFSFKYQFLPNYLTSDHFLQKLSQQHKKMKITDNSDKEVTPLLNTYLLPARSQHTKIFSMDRHSSNSYTSIEIAFIVASLGMYAYLRNCVGLDEKITTPANIIKIAFAIIIPPAAMVIGMFSLFCSEKNSDKFEEQNVRIRDARI